MGPIEDGLAAQGKELFETRCKTCHKLDEEHIGPTLRNVTDRRDPVFIMNMILAPEEMIQKHPTGQELFAEYGTMMTNQNLSREQARALLEYFRQVGQ
jgi:putative heme-binding domain-containing protein